MTGFPSGPPAAVSLPGGLTDGIAGVINAVDLEGSIALRDVVDHWWSAKSQFLVYCLCSLTMAGASAVLLGVLSLAPAGCLTVAGSVVVAYLSSFQKVRMARWRPDPRRPRGFYPYIVPIPRAPSFERSYRLSAHYFLAVLSMTVVAALSVSVSVSVYFDRFPDLSPIVCLSVFPVTAFIRFGMTIRSYRRAYVQYVLSDVIDS